MTGCLSSLKEYDPDRVTVRVTVGDPQEVNGGKRKQEVLIADATGSTILTLWETDINLLEESKSYQLNRLMLRVYLGKYQLSYDEDANLVGASTTGVQVLDKVYTCINCKKGKSANIGTCTNCGTMHKLTNEKLTAKLYIQMDKKRFSLRAFDDNLKIVQEDAITCETLLCSPW